MHNAKASNRPTQEIQNDFTSKPRDLEQKLNEEQTRNKSHLHKGGTLCQLVSTRFVTTHYGNNQEIPC